MCVLTFSFKVKIGVSDASSKILLSERLNIGSLTLKRRLPLTSVTAKLPSVIVITFRTIPNSTGYGAQKLGFTIAILKLSLFLLLSDCCIRWLRMRLCTFISSCCLFIATIFRVDAWMVHLFFDKHVTNSHKRVE